MAEPRSTHITVPPRQLHSSLHWNRTGVCSLMLAMVVLTIIGVADILKISVEQYSHRALLHSAHTPFGDTNTTLDLSGPAKVAMQ